jgi:D-alanyl-D-alanine carboxypeptidase
MMSFLVTRMSVLGVVAVIAVVTACAPSAPRAAPATGPVAVAGTPFDRTAQIDQLAAAVLGNGITGAIVSVADPAHGTHLKAYGTTDAAGTPMTVGMHYRIASVSKTFTAHAVLELAGQGKLSLDDPLARFVPDIPHCEAITVRDLLGLRGGVYDFATDPGPSRPLPGRSDPARLEPRRRVADHPRAPRQGVAPRTGTVYSNSEYILLGYVIERASGQPAPDPSPA